MSLLIVLLIPSPGKTYEIRAVSIDFPDPDPFPVSLCLFIILKNI